MSKSYSSFLTQQQQQDRILRLELALGVLIKEVVSGSTNPIVREVLMDFCDQIRDEAGPPR